MKITSYSKFVLLYVVCPKGCKLVPDENRNFIWRNKKKIKHLENILTSLKWLDIFIKLETFIVIKFKFNMFWYTLPFNNSQLQKTKITVL